MSAQIRHERKDYYTMLERTQKGALDITGSQEWFLGCLLRVIDGADKTLGAALEKGRFWQRFAAESMSARQIKLLNKLLDGFKDKLTSYKWAKIAKSSQDTAHRDIVDPIVRGTVLQDSSGERSTSYALIVD